MFQHDIIGARQDNEISQLLVQPHIAKTFKFALGKTVFEEEVVVHMQCLIAQAVGDSFHETFQFLINTLGKENYKLHPAPNKGMQRMSNETRSPQDYRHCAHPRGLFNCDVIRNMIACKTVNGMLALAEMLCKAFDGYVKFKNLFALSEKELEARHHLSSLMMSVQCTAPMTCGTMCENKSVKEMWQRHKNAVTACMSRERWEKGFNRATECLPSDALKDERVIVFAEVQILFETAIEVRKLMHESCKVGRTTTDTELWMDILLSSNVDSAASTALLPDLEDAACLCAACERGQLQRVKEFVAGGADVNANSSGQPMLPLVCAAFYQQVDVVAHLLDQGADVNGTDTKHFGTALHHAAENGELDCVYNLIQHGAAMNQSNVDGVHPLHVAVQEGFADVVKLLIQRNADVNKPISTGCTPLVAARAHRHHSTVGILENAGATLGGGINRERTPRKQKVKKIRQHGTGITRARVSNAKPPPPRPPSRSKKPKSSERQFTVPIFIAQRCLVRDRLARCF